ncbi:junction-mediating and -regulatory protein isoform X2 [Cottoperca gobio]|uniref:Junction-mediating and -regulatory protein isoform X2 n=1 Tax=Cottoperca gobio TaxID=56716 RepID=A0A6J2QQJ2_COTGO|nr:junction-mediating and -regulatory protein isoform X2 [Cottoperca gobio]
MSFTMEDNLESEWVSVRPRVFDEKERHKFIFIVAWNDIEGKFAITCHNRTVQKRSTFLLDPLLDLPSPGASVAEKHTKSMKDEVCQAGKVRSHSDPKGKPSTKTVLGDTNTLKPGDSKTSECVSPTLGSWDIVTPKVIDIEILDPVDVQLSPDDSDPGDGDSSGREDFSWAGLFSFQDLRAVHLQLCAVNSDLEPCLPSFPEEQSGVWSVLFGAPGVSQRETDALCYQLQVYLGHALDTCGWKILSEVLFSESEDTEEYYESLSELRQKGYEDALERAKRQMQEVLDKHKALDSMVELLQVYPEEDEAYGELLEATTQLYHYLLQPFRDMRELAMLRRQQIKISLETERLGPRRVESLRKEDEEWQKKAHAAVLSIQNLTVKFFETTTRAQKALYERMRADQKKFGKSAWAAAVERMERLQYAVSKETLQLMRAKEICLEQRKHGLKEEMQSLQGGEDAMLRLDQLEALYYELQLQLYDIGAEVLRCEELLLTAQLQSLRRQMTERQDEVVYYDAFESPDAMKGEEDPAAPPSPLRDEELTVLQQRTRQLEARRGRITAKKVYLKNKKEICIVNHNLKKRQGSHDDSPQTLQQGGEDEEDDEAKSNARVSQDRQRTLDRLRSLKQRYPGQVTLKSSRLRQFQPHSRRRAGQQASTHSAGVQTDCVSDLPELSAPPPPDTCSCDSVSLPTVELGNLDSTPFLSLPPLSSSPSIHSLGPPPPPPPPPQQQGEGIENNPSPLRHRERESELSSLPLAPFSPRFFDSSQLQTARKKLKKTASLDSTQWKGSTPMDEVLASLKRGCFHLRKAELRVLAPDPDDDTNNILAQIRQGVRLKKVRTRPEQKRQAKSFTSSADALTRSIHEALRRIKEASPESESEDEGLPCTDWEI